MAQYELDPHYWMDASMANAKRHAIDWLKAQGVATCNMILALKDDPLATKERIQFLADKCGVLEGCVKALREGTVGILPKP